MGPKAVFDLSYKVQYPNKVEDALQFYTFLKDIFYK